MSYILPHVEVEERFDRIPAELTEPLRAVVIGPHAQLVRHAVPAERALGLLGDVDPLTDTAYAFPSRATGAIVDPGYTAVFVDGARLRYFADPVGSGLTITAAPGATNKVKASDALGFKASLAAGRITGLYGRDVAPGDRVLLASTASGVTTTLDSYVVGFDGDPIAAAVGAASAAPGNAASQSASSSVAVASGTPGTISLTLTATAYNGLPDGALNEVYTLTVLSGSVGGDMTTAQLRVTSASGLDSVVSTAAAAIGTPFAVGTRGLTATLADSAPGSSSNLTPGLTWTLHVAQLFAATTSTAGGAYSGDSDDTYIVEVVRGGIIGDSDASKTPTFVVRTAKGLDGAPAVVVAAANTAYAAGTKGVTWKVNVGVTTLDKGDIFYVPVSAAAVGRLGTLVLANDLPAPLLAAADISLTLYVRRDIELDRRRLGYEPIVNWSQTALNLTIAAGAVVNAPDFVDNMGLPLPLALVGGTAYAQYRAWRSDLAGELAGLSDPSSLDALIVGDDHPDNPLKRGVSAALAAASGTEVRFIAVADPDSLPSWNTAIAELTGRDDIFGLVPLTRDPQVLAAFVAHVNAERGRGKSNFRMLWTSPLAPPSVALVDAGTSSDNAPVLGVVADDPAQTGTQYTRLDVTTGNAAFITAGVRPGDTVRYLFASSWGVDTYASYTIDAVLTETSLRLTSGPTAAISSPQKLEVWRAQSKDDVAAFVRDASAALGNRANLSVWPDVVGSGRHHAGRLLPRLLAGRPALRRPAPPGPDQRRGRRI